MWAHQWRDRVWARLGQHWDLVVVGGGITGAGVLRLAAQLGLRALLLEARDFGWGTSSRSTKLVHGGLRYLAQGQFHVTRQSVRERERLAAEGPGLVDWMGFLFPIYQGTSPGQRSLALGLAFYDLFARKWAHAYHQAESFALLAPHIRRGRLRGGFLYEDAVTDDARLVLRVLREAVRAGAAALNYAEVRSLLFDRAGHVNGVAVRDIATGRQADVRARAVVNATGAWSDTLRAQVGGEPRMRPSRGSHLIFPSWRLPLAQSCTLVHPGDGRPVFVLPWEGVAVAGTTDLDHGQPLGEEPHITTVEVDYLMSALQAGFPTLNLKTQDAIASFSGVRPILGSGTGDPSKESRAHAVMQEKGLVTVAGGKLTTFHAMAQDTVQAVRGLLPEIRPVTREVRALDAVPADLLDGEVFDREQRRRLLGRYGVDAPNLVAAARPGELHAIEATSFLWAELRWAARDEGVMHLDDLLLRRVRVGLLLPQGAMALLDRIRTIAQPELGWDDLRWEAETAAYAETWQRGYSLPVAH